MNENASRNQDQIDFKELYDLILLKKKLVLFMLVLSLTLVGHMNMTKVERLLLRDLVRMLKQPMLKVLKKVLMQRGLSHKWHVIMILFLPPLLGT